MKGSQYALGCYYQEMMYIVGLLLISTWEAKFQDGGKNKWGYFGWMVVSEMFVWVMSLCGSGAFGGGE